MRREVREREDDPGGVGRRAEQPQINERILCIAGQPALAAEENDEQDRGRDTSSASRASRTLSYSTAANRMQNVAPPSSAAPSDVEPVPPVPSVVGQQPPGQHDHRDTDRDVDEEHQPPAEVRAAECDQRAADERAERGAHPDRRPQHAEGPSPLVAAEQLLHESGHLRVDQAARQPLQHPRRDKHRAVGASPASMLVAAKPPTPTETSAAARDRPRAVRPTPAPGRTRACTR